MISMSCLGVGRRENCAATRSISNMTYSAFPSSSSRPPPLFSSTNARNASTHCAGTMDHTLSVSMGSPAGGHMAPCRRLRFRHFKQSELSFVFCLYFLIQLGRTTVDPPPAPAKQTPHLRVAIRRRTRRHTSPAASSHLATQARCPHHRDMQVPVVPRHHPAPPRFPPATPPPRRAASHSRHVPRLTAAPPSRDIVPPRYSSPRSPLRSHAPRQAPSLHLNTSCVVTYIRLNIFSFSRPEMLIL